MELARAHLRRDGQPRVSSAGGPRPGLETAEQTAQPFMLHITELYGAAIALCDGRLEEAEATAGRSRRVEPA